MKKGRTKFLFVLMMAFALLGILGTLLGGCEKAETKELLIYCGNTMIQPVSDIARIIEKQENCKIIIIKDGSGNLLRSIKVNQLGDLYLPGSDSYIKTCQADDLISETVLVGYNKAALLVQKGNPKHISADLANLARTELFVVIGNPDSGAIGKETKKILQKKGIFPAVLRNSRELTTDTKDLVKAIKNKQADLVVSWYASSQWVENEPYIDVLGIDENFATKKKLVLGLLKTTRYPDIARAFMTYATSDLGRDTFDKYGFYNVK
ncbi:MAG: substrate-binding domain-containing protein [Gemmatimonadales bacterium]|nr:substrate-binding domain-containing protein [Gemmatimonadales bacterium]